MNEMAPHSGDDEQVTVPCTIMRGGTSKGVIFTEKDLPSDPRIRDRLIMAVMGSPDPRQIDGLGGSDPLTSKICIVGPSERPDADIDYTFGQVGIDEPFVAMTTNCGNLSAAVGVYAIEEGYVAPRSDTTVVRIFNTNTRQIFLAHVPMRNGRPTITGDYVISGVPGTSAEIRLDFSRTTGATTGKLLPTGNRKDTLYVPALGHSVEVSIVDVAKATLYFRAEAIGLTGTESPDAFTPAILDRFWRLREVAAEAIGIGSNKRLPTPVAVAPPAAYQNYMTKAMIRAEEMSFATRRVLGPPPKLHKAFAATGAVCTAVAAQLKGTVVNDVYVDRGQNIVRIGHPTGIFPVYARIDADGTVHEASYSRTARRIMDGKAYVRRSALDADPVALSEEEMRQLTTVGDE
jgi:2-methylaconitate cis-trans-isomerase PrpF